MANITEKKGINVTSGFKLISPAPVDARYVVEDETELQSIIDNGAAYNGLEVWVNSLGKKKQYNGTEFVEVQAGGGVSEEVIGDINAVLDEINGGGTIGDSEEMVEIEVNISTSGTTGVYNVVTNGIDNKLFDDAKKIVIYTNEFFIHLVNKTFVNMEGIRLNTYSNFTSLDNEISITTLIHSIYNGNSYITIECSGASDGVLQSFISIGKTNIKLQFYL